MGWIRVSHFFSHVFLFHGEEAGWRAPYIIMFYGATQTTILFLFVNGDPLSRIFSYTGHYYNRDTRFAVLTQRVFFFFLSSSR